jgi:hypothetical protein
MIFLSRQASSCPILLQGEDSFLDLRAGIVELEFEASSLYFFLSLFLRTFEKTDRFPVEKLYSLTGEM